MNSSTGPPLHHPSQRHYCCSSSGLPAPVQCVAATKMYEHQSLSGRHPTPWPHPRYSSSCTATTTCLLLSRSRLSWTFFIFPPTQFYLHNNCIAVAFSLVTSQRRPSSSAAAVPCRSAYKVLSTPSFHEFSYQAGAAGVQLCRAPRLSVRLCLPAGVFGDDEDVVRYSMCASVGKRLRMGRDVELLFGI